MSPVVGAHEIAEMLGVTKQRVHQLAKTPGFPSPIAHLQAGTIWNTDDIGEWRTQMRPDTGNVPRVPPRDPERPTDDPYDSNVVRFLLSRPGGADWTRGTLTEHLRGQARLDQARVRQARSFATRHGVSVRAHADGKTEHFFRSDPEAPTPYPSSEAERRTWRSQALN